MSTNDLTVTLVGWVGTEPRHYTGATATPFTSFRMANTRRYFDRAQDAWADGRTEWFTVKVWRQSALNVASSLRKGDPVLVHGRLSTEQWESPEGPRTSLVLEALAIGPDLTYGRATFARTVHVAPGTPDVGSGEDGGGGRDADDPWASDLLGGGDRPPAGEDGAGGAGDPATSGPAVEADDGDRELDRV
ncbi:single-stranded DNA-binding protein [Cellulomonas aerilata]|uniref:Single-stranded DNA-binding protein n=1 Tax=Cellulomonas aerilata TaxID=515326 RepID=A0A512DC33_9CELL|nr:single-stranded DNA-binding protein [Cellulomonas aerilata]GEO34039.1 single-stranded DNA-binding protein [Cellulomonas aerilata]